MAGKKSSLSSYIISSPITPTVYDAIVQEHKMINSVIFLINQTLEIFGFPKLGDLSKVDTENLAQTNISINSILKQLNIDSNYKREAKTKIKKLEKDILHLTMKQDELIKMNEKYENNITIHKTEFKIMKERMDEEKKKLEDEKYELTKSNLQLQSLKSYLQNEIRRRENENELLKRKVINSLIIDNYKVQQH